jgi:tRNA-2-methylthio-N6-dimethylallyladenosine synthase
MDFPDLLRQIDRLNIDRVRFVTSHPRDFSSRLVEAIAELESVCEHVHLPLQSGSDRVLAGMNRKYTYEQYLEKVCMLRDRVPGVAITTDIIAGFPGETDEDHAATVKALEEVAFDGIFAFKFSNRDGTVACGMKGQLPEEVKSERLKELLKIQEKITFAKNRTLEATEQEILVEGPSETDASVVMGRTRTNKIVTVSAACSPGEIIKVRIKRARLHSLEAVLPDI